MNDPDITSTEHRGDRGHPVSDGNENDDSTREPEDGDDDEQVAGLGNPDTATSITTGTTEIPTPEPEPESPTTHVLTLFLKHKDTELRFQSDRHAYDVLVENGLDEAVWAWADILDDLAHILLVELAARIVRDPEGGTSDLRAKRVKPKTKIVRGKAVIPKPTVITFELPQDDSDPLTVRGIARETGDVAFDVYVRNAADEMVWAPYNEGTDAIYIMRAWYILFPQATIDLRESDAQA
jgi:hypothetical protein